MKVLVAGDFCPQKRVSAAFHQEGYQRVLGGIKPVVEAADFSLVNFECPVTKGKGTPISKFGSSLQCSEKGMEAVRWAGFDAVTLANNHFYDYGEEGVDATLEACRKYGISTVGGGHDIREASETLYRRVNGQTLAVINCCEHEFSIATDQKGGSNPLHPLRQYYAIQEARSKADHLLVVVHGGHEHFQLPSPRMQETYRFFIDAGADAVVNHHQHCYSGYEVYHGKPVFYGLGNFCFDLPGYSNPAWYEGYLVVLEFGDGNPGFTLLPYRQCCGNPGVEPLPQNAFEDKLKELNAVISDPERLRAAIEEYYDSCAETFSNVLEPIRNRFYLGAKRRGWLPSLIGRSRKLYAADVILCESHRDKLARWLEK
jgi:poly-gamma-glutamate synthesis protein (capsule biosynthesis protein)